MKTRSMLLAAVLAGVAFCGAARGAEKSSWMAKLKALADGEWTDTGVAYAYTGEVPLAYSPDHRLLFRYGGCTRGRGSYEDYSYANDFWVMNADNGKWDMRRAVHMYGAARRPNAGCSRSFCYDRKRKLFWLCHGIGNFGTGSTAMISYDPVKDVFTPARASGSHGGDGTMMCYDPVHDLVVRVARGSTLLFDPKRKAWKKGAAPPHGAGMYRNITCDQHRGRVILLTDGSETWQPGQPYPKRGAKYERVMRTWSYDPGANKWTDLKPGGDKLEPRTNFVIAYDTRNKAVLYFAAGSGDGSGDRGMSSQTYVLELAANKWKKQSPGTSPPPRLIKASAVYDENHNVLLAYVAGRLWAYRYQGGFPKGKR